jgi:hypothetical protein
LTAVPTAPLRSGTSVSTGALAVSGPPEFMRTMLATEGTPALFSAKIM